MGCAEQGIMGKGRKWGEGERAERKLQGKWLVNRSPAKS